SSLLQGGAVPSPLAAGLLETSTSIDSDFEEASLLVQFARQQPIDAPGRPPLALVRSPPPAADRRDRARPVLQGAGDGRELVRAQPGVADTAAADRPVAGGARRSPGGSRGRRFEFRDREQ